MLEAEIESHLIARVRDLGGRAYKFRSGTAGVPDRLVVLPGGRVLFVELKAPRGRLSPLQVRELDFLLHLGCRAAVLNSKEAVDDLMAEYDVDEEGFTLCRP